MMIVGMNTDVYAAILRIIGIDIVQFPQRQEYLDGGNCTANSRKEEDRGKEICKDLGQRQNNSAEAYQQQAYDECARSKCPGGPRDRICVEAKAHR